MEMEISAAISALVAWEGLYVCVSSVNVVLINKVHTHVITVQGVCKNNQTKFQTMPRRYVNKTLTPEITLILFT